MSPVETPFTELANYAYAIVPFLSFKDFKRLRLASKTLNYACLGKEVINFLNKYILIRA